MGWTKLADFSPTTLSTSKKEIQKTSSAISTTRTSRCESKSRRTNETKPLTWPKKSRLKSKPITGSLSFRPSMGSNSLTSTTLMNWGLKMRPSPLDPPRPSRWTAESFTCHSREGLTKSHTSFSLETRYPKSSWWSARLKGWILWKTSSKQMASRLKLVKPHTSTKVSQWIPVTT